MIVAGVIVAILALAAALVIAIALEPGPGPVDVAVAYELAWDHFDFDGLWVLSSPELRDGRDRRAFVAAKSEAYREQTRLRSIVEKVEVEGAAADGRRAATVHTRLVVRDGGTVHHEIRVMRRQGAWQVVRYSLRPEPTAAP